MARTKNTQWRVEKRRLTNKQKAQSTTAVENVTGQWIQEMLQLDDLQKRKEKCLEYRANNGEEQKAIENDINGAETAEKNRYYLVLHKNRIAELADQKDTLATFHNEKVVAVEEKARGKQERDAALTSEQKTARGKERQVEGLAAKKKARAQKREKKKMRAQQKEEQEN